MEMTKAFAASLYDGAGYIQQLHAAPGHVLPVLKTVAEDPAYLDNPIIEKYTGRGGPDVSSPRLPATTSVGRARSTSPTSRPVRSSAQGVLAEMVQRVVLNDEDAGQVIGDTAKAIEEDHEGLTGGINVVATGAPSARGLPNLRERALSIDASTSRTKLCSARHPADRAHGARVLCGDRLSADFGDLSQPVFDLHADA